MAADGGSGVLTTANDGRIDPAVIASLYERHGDELQQFLTGVLRNADLAAEALQNTFAKAVESGHRAREESLKGWLFQVGFREALLLRRRSRTQERSLREMARTDERAKATNEFGSPGDRLFKKEMTEQIRQALEELPADQRQVVQMRIYEEKTFATIAEELSTPLGTVLTRMRLALNRLSRTLQRDQDDPRLL